MNISQKTLRFGIKTSPQYTPYEDIVALWREADSLPVIEHIWLYDHLLPASTDPTGICFEGWTLLAALAALTKRINLGILVSSNTFRHPALLAKMATTVDTISAGRLAVGIGAGWIELEHRAYGLSLYSTGERVRRLGEACEILRKMWTEETPTFEGRYYQIKEAYCNPGPCQKPSLPLIIGGEGEQLLLLVARYADIWNIAYCTLEKFLDRKEVLERHCQTCGRDFTTIELSIQTVAEPQNLPTLRENLESFIQAGVTHIVLNIRYPYPEGILQHIIAEVILPLRAKFH